MNLSGVSLQAERVKPLLEDLNKTLTFYKELSESAPPLFRHLKTSYIIALESAFKVDQRCRDLDFKEILLQDSKRKRSKFLGDNIFDDHIYQKSLEIGTPWGCIGWLENRHLYLMNSNGFPLGLIPITDLSGEELAEFLISVKFKEQKPDFFLGETCELLYNTFGHLCTSGYPGCTMKEVFIYKQLSDWSDTSAFRMEKVLICGDGGSMSDDRVAGALGAINGFRNNMEYIKSRIALVTGEKPLSDQDLNYTCFISSLFKSIFDNIRANHHL